MDGKEQAAKSSSTPVYANSALPQSYNSQPYQGRGHSIPQGSSVAQSSYTTSQPLPPPLTQRHLQEGLLQQVRPLAQLATKSIVAFLPHVLPRSVPAALHQVRSDLPPEAVLELMLKELTTTLPQTLEDALGQSLSARLSKTPLGQHEIFSQELPDAVQQVLEQVLRDALPLAQKEAHLNDVAAALSNGATTASGIISAGGTSYSERNCRYCSRDQRANSFRASVDSRCRPSGTTETQS